MVEREWVMPPTQGRSCDRLAAASVSATMIEAGMTINAPQRGQFMVVEYVECGRSSRARAFQARSAGENQGLGSHRIE